MAPTSSLAGRTVEILLYDFDAFTRHRGLGYVQLPLSSVPDLGTNFTTITKPILRYGTEGGFKAPPLGELMISVSYQPSIEKLTIIIVRARNLPALDDPASASPYVKVCIHSIVYVFLLPFSFFVFTQRKTKRNFTLTFKSNFLIYIYRF